jgi:hypothetical protein
VLKHKMSRIVAARFSERWVPLGSKALLVVRVLGHRSRSPGFDSRRSDFLRSSGSGRGSTQPREYN